MNSPDSHTKFTAMLSPFCAGISNARLYGANHPLVPKCIEKAYGLIRSLLEDIEPLTFFLVGTDIVLGDQAVLSPRRHRGEIRRDPAGKRGRAGHVPEGPSVRRVPCVC